MCAAATAVVATLVVFSMLGAAPGHAQTQSQSSSASAPSAQPKLEYEVATIKPYKPGTGEGPGVFRMGIMNAPDGFSATGVTIQTLITMAYGIKDYQLSGAPSWLNSERYEIDAKMDGGVADALQKMSSDDRNAARLQMLQALLADRLKLAIHRDTKEGQIYTLVVGKNGPKLKEATAEELASPPPGGPRGGGDGGGGGGGRIGGPGTIRFGRGAGGAQSFSLQAIPISTLADMLSRNVSRPVVDKTGLTGKYDIKLEWAPDDAQLQSPPGGAPATLNGQPVPDSSAPPLLTAIQEQLGLKLESGKGPVEYIVIEHIEKPSDN
jgi:uncharacterized protein (TIGR03435 family)